MKDALGHGSNSRGGTNPIRETFNRGIAAARSVPRTALALMQDNRGSGIDLSHAAINFVAKYGDKFDPQTIGELPATRMIGMAAHALGYM